MGANLAIGVVNLVDATGATVTCANQHADYPAANLQASELGAPLRTLDATSVSNKIVATLAAAVTLSQFAVALVKHNLQSSATWTIVFKSGVTTVRTVTARAVNADGYWSSKIDGQSRNVALYQDSSSLTFDSLEISISDATNPDGYFEIPRLFIGSLIVPVVGFSYEYQPQWVDPSERGEAAGGNMVHRLRTKYRKGAFKLPILADAEAWDDFFGTVDALAGKTKDCLVIPDRTSSTRLHMRLLWGPQDELSALGPVAFQKYNKTITFRERT